MEKEKSKRRTGRTTRLADRYIQQLFKDGEITIVDHTDIDESSLNLLYIISQRLNREHPNTNYTVSYNPYKIKL